MNQVTKTTFKSDKRIKVWKIKGEKDGPKLLITAGVHGGENTGIQVAFELIDHFTNDKTLRGQVTIVPIVNVEGYKQQTRDNPKDSKNINASGINGEFKPGNYSQSDAIADEILLLGEKGNYVLDLHSGFKNRYLHHVYYADHQDIEIARSFGFPFIVYQTESVKGSENNGTHKETLFSRIRKKGRLAFALETGGGFTIRPVDVNLAIKGILSFCDQVGLLKNSPSRRKTPKIRVFIKSREKIASVIKAPRPGNLYLARNLGQIIKKGEIVGSLLDLKTHQRFPIKSSAEGMLVLKRDLFRIEADEVGKETIFRIMPKSGSYS